jgi:hypothetical protein
VLVVQIGGVAAQSQINRRMKIPRGVLGRVRGGPDAGRFVEVIEESEANCVRVFSYADRDRSTEILDGVFLSYESLEQYFSGADWDVEWLYEA